MDERTSKHQQLLANLKHDERRLDLAERDAYRLLLAAIEAHPPTQDAYRRWQRVREERETVAVRLDVLQAAMTAGRDRTCRDD